MPEYDHGKIEKKWQKEWERKKLFQAKDKSDKPKFYGLIEFPFPSGDGMHAGHLRSNTAIDIISRKRRAEGFNVLYPIGWDAFGLPTENYAIKTGIHPKIVNKKNTDNFRRQLKSAGFSFDWSREINTTDPAYYRWTQWIFLKLYKHGLAYKAKMNINWCPKDKIGLANEEVIDGKCERCGTVVEKREKDQWVLAITQYADRLDKDLDTVDFQERIKLQQRNWIGKSEGAEISFPLVFDVKKDDGSEHKGAAIPVFTTRPETIFGATYMVLSPEHLWVTLATDDNHHVLKNKDEVKKYVAEAKKKSEIERTAADKDKTGFEIKGVRAINPATKKEIPIYVADYVLAGYGTGAIMAVPAHDERDWQFAKKYKLPVAEVIEPLFIKTSSDKAGEKDGVREGLPFVKRHAAVAVIKHWSEDKYLCLKWKQTDWRGFVVGGIEDGESIATTGEREIAEETGYTSAKFIKELGGTVHAQFYHAVKNQNRWAHYHAAYFELTDGNRKEMAEEEKKIHDVVWVDKNEVDKFLDWVTDMRLIWYRAIHPDAFPGRSALHETSRVAERGILTGSGQFNGLTVEEAREKITKFVGGKMVNTYKLRDWIFSRQRYWGEPIPMIHCEACAKKNPETGGWVPVPEKDLPVKLPDVKNYKPTDTGESPLAAITKWVNTKCPVCKGPARRETDVMPNWAGSSWYYLRYVDPKNKKMLAAPDKLKYWTPVDWYNGGMEHTTLHLLYSRFWHKFLFDIGVVPTSEPYMKRTSHGIILASDGEKMSKSRGNVVSPDPIIKTYGADTLRVYEMFMGPFQQMVAWDEKSIIGSRRFIEKVWRLQDKLVKKAPFDAELETLINKTIQKVSDDIESMSFNTAISALMILTNAMDKKEELAEGYYKHLIKLLAPFAPHVAEEIWSKLGNKTSITLEKWQKADPSKMQETVRSIPVQVNGKTRGQIMLGLDATENLIRQIVNADEGIAKWFSGKEIKKIIFVPGKIVNIVA